MNVINKVVTENTIFFTEMPCVVYLLFCLMHIAQVHGFNYEDPTSTPCINIIKSGHSGSLTIPKYKERNLNSMCLKWILNDPGNKTLIISIGELHIQDGRSCARRKVRVLDAYRIFMVFCDKNKTQMYSMWVPAYHPISVELWVAGYSSSRRFSMSYIFTERSGRCRPNEHRCLNGYCIPLRWRCNGVTECGDGSDESNCDQLETTARACPKGQIHCGGEESACYPHEARCDFKVDCTTTAADEKGCNCPPDLLPCSATSRNCYHLRERCNGQAWCKNGADELGCTSAQCGPFNGTHLCDNGQCIYETWICDGAHDCADSSDERDCPIAQRRVIIAAVVGSTLCALLLVIALGCSCKLVALLNDDHRGPSRSATLSRMRAEISRRQAPPTYAETVSSDSELSRGSRRHQRRQRRRSNRRRNADIPDSFVNPSFVDDSLSGVGVDVVAQSNDIAEARLVRTFPADGVSVQFHKSPTAIKPSIPDAMSVCSYDAQPDTASINSAELPPPYSEESERSGAGNCFNDAFNFAVNSRDGDGSRPDASRPDASRSRGPNESFGNASHDVVLIDLSNDAHSALCDSLTNRVTLTTPATFTTVNIPTSILPVSMATYNPQTDQSYCDSDDSDLIDVS